VAVNVGLVPVHIELLGVLIEIVGVTCDETLIVIALLVTFEAPQGKLPVRTQVTMSPLFQEDAVYVEELVPTFEPFFFHW
jgi:hypothetical protein